MEPSNDDPFPSLLILADSLNSFDTLYIAGELVVLLLLLVSSALISGSEVAFFSFTHRDIEACKKSTKPGVRNIVKLLRNPRQLLATILILNNFINIAFVMVATFMTWQITGTNTTEGELAVILTIIITTAIVFFGEVVPKVYASKNNISFAGFTSYGITVASKIFRPLSFILMKLSNIIESRVETRGYDLTMEEIGHALEITTDENTSDEERDILKGIVNFGSLSVKQVMRSRLDITAFDEEIDYHELMDKVNKTGYSRVPVYKETIDNIEGLLYVKDLLPYTDREEDFEWQNLLRPAFFIPENKKVDSLLRDFQEKRVHMAVVVDEYGGTSGVITLEDVIEEIVGEINDEFDDEFKGYNKLDKNTYVFEGKTSLNDFAKTVAIDIGIFDDIKGESESLAGLLLELHSKLPRVGEKIHFSNFVFTVVAVDNKKIKKVRVFIKPKKQEIQDATVQNKKNG